MLIDQVVFILEKVHIIWEPVLPPSTYKRSMSMVLESVFSRMTKDILLLDDLAAEETLQVHLCIPLKTFITFKCLCYKLPNLMSPATKVDPFDAGKSVFFIGVLDCCRPKRDITRRFCTSSWWSHSISTQNPQSGRYVFFFFFVLVLNFSTNWEKIILWLPTKIWGHFFFMFKYHQIY